MRVCASVFRLTVSRLLYSVLILFTFLAFAPRTAVSQESQKDQIETGRYIFALAGGCACHTVPKGTPHAGGRAFPVPAGKLYSTNITSSNENGLGGWANAQIYAAMVKGIRPDGVRLLPVMPYEAYSGMAEEDITALLDHLKTLKPASTANFPLDAWIPFYRSLWTPIWLKFFGRFNIPPPRAPQQGIERGRYLVEHVSLCGDCHTPRNIFGVAKRNLYLAGAKVGPLGQEIPNITPDKRTGIGDWSRDQIATSLLTGIKPDQEPMEGLMAEVIEGGYKYMKRQDALAIADYLKSIPPVANRIK